MADTVPPPDAYIKDMDEKIAQSNELHKLSSQEFDKQVVYIAGGGLALTLTFAKDIASITGSSFYAVSLLLITWLCFAAALLINLFSYRKAAKTYDAATSLHRHYRECHAAQQAIKQPQCDTWQSTMNKGAAQVHRLNSWAFGSTAAGIVFFILFVLLNVITMSKKTSKPDSTPAPTTAAGNPRRLINEGIESPSFLLTTPPPPPPAPPAAAPTPSTLPASTSAQ